MQEEVRDKSVALVINVGKNGGRMTASLLKWAMRQYMQQSRNPHIHHGKQTVKQLVRQGAGVQNIEITDKNIKSFEHIARKYGVDYALKKDPGEGKYLVFFKAKETLKRDKSKPSLLSRLTHFKEVVKNQSRDTEKHRQKGGIEL